MSDIKTVREQLSSWYDGFLDATEIGGDATTYVDLVCFNETDKNNGSENIYQYYLYRMFKIGDKWEISIDGKFPLRIPFNYSEEKNLEIRKAFQDFLKEVGHSLR